MSVLSVTDNGIGMDEETQRRAMEPFFTTKGPGKGTGLGLSMVHGVAEQSGGWFTLRSRKGEGTTAELWLPSADGRPVRAQVQAQTGWIAARRPGQSRFARCPGGGRRQPRADQHRRHAGGPWPHRNSGIVRDRPRSKYSKKRDDVDLVITDYAMPGMNGDGACRGDPGSVAGPPGRDRHRLRRNGQRSRNDAAETGEAVFPGRLGQGAASASFRKAARADGC